jgi:hypothetical protein
MLFNQEKNLVAWNGEVLDTYHDIIVSFDYARYSTLDVPQGGFCVVFFETEQEVPIIGGPGSSLGYTPSNQKDYCYVKGYNGFVYGYLGVGFDINGEFGYNNGLVDGLLTPVPNSCTIRSSSEERYKHIATSRNLLYSPVPFLVAEKLTDEKDAKYKSVRVIISKAFTSIEVQIKNIEDRNFTTILSTKIPQRRRTGVKVGITNTMLDSFTKFDLKNFNVAGFPGFVTEPELRDCANIKPLNTNIQGRTMVSTNDFCAVPVGDGVILYEIRDSQLAIKQIIEEDEPIYLIGGNEKFLFLNKKETDEVDVYYKASNSFLKTQTISLCSDINDISLGEVGDYPYCAATDNKSLAIGNKKHLFIYEYYSTSSTFGVFAFLQTITNNPSGDIGFSVQMDKGKLLTGGGTPRVDGTRNSFVSFYEYTGNSWNDLPTQTFSSPNTGNIYNEFGSAIAIQGNEAIIGSPNEDRRGRTTLGHGEAYHYVYLRTRKQWRPVMGLGNTYSIDSPAGNFGTSVAFLGNNCVISAPYENYLFPPDLAFENKPNCGRVYIFRKNRGGTFSQSSAIAPDFERAKEYMLFGRYVGLLGNRTALVAVPYNNILINAELDSYKIGCVFDVPPDHKAIELDSISLYDKSGYQIDMETYTYLKLININRNLDDYKQLI